MAARHARDVFRLGADGCAKSQIGRNVARVQRNHSSDVFRRLVRPQIRADERHIVIAETLGHCTALIDNVLLDVHADDTAAAMQYLVDVVIHDKAEVGFAAGAVQQHDLVAVVLLKHGRNQLNVVVDLIVLADHVVFQLAVCGQDADLAQQRRRLIDADEVLPAAVEQRIGGSRLFLGGRFALSLLHLYAACRHGQRNDRAALGIGEHALVVFLSLLGKEGAEFSRVYAAVAALKMQRVVLVCAGQLCVKFLFAGNQGAICLHKKIAVFGQPC